MIIGLTRLLLIRPAKSYRFTALRQGHIKTCGPWAENFKWAYELSVFTA